MDRREPRLREPLAEPGVEAPVLEALEAVAGDDDGVRSTMEVELLFRRGPETGPPARLVMLGSRTVTAHLVTGAATFSISTAWKSSLNRRARGAWPVNTRIGVESACAE